MTGESAICRVVHVMLRYGPEFDHDPQQGWAREILDDPYMVDADVKAYRLLEHALAARP